MIRNIIANLDNVTDRDFIKNQCNKRLLGGLYYERFSGIDGIDVMAQEWDTLVLLDACRYDTFAEMKPDSWPPVNAVTSRAPNTWEFYQRNFTDGPYTDTVVVTANPRTVELRGDEFHDILKAYEFGWDDDDGTVPPSTMAEATIEAHDRYPNKRILSHWIQPHYPFIGSSRLAEYRLDTESVWADVNRGLVPPEDVYEAYTETLEMTLPYVEEVFSSVDGRVVLTADHGNAFGERPWFYPLKIYGHPRGVHLPCLITVPWLVVEDGSRRQVETGNSKQIDPGASARERLEDLGYLG
jgi:hypothetical protein